MIDLTDPLDIFPSLRDEHAGLVDDYFEDLVRTSGVDEAANSQTIAELESLDAEISDGAHALRRLRSVQVLATLVALTLAIWAAAARGAYLLLLLLSIGGVVLAFRLSHHAARVKETQSDLKNRRTAKAAEAAAQMAPLNSLHQWGVARTLFQQVIPDVAFDDFLADDRLARLYADYGLSPSFTDGRSMLAVQSGAFRDNPFVFSKYLHHWIGSHTYFGSIVIHWTERVRDANGNWTTVQRSQTLTASVVKPFPCYVTATVLLYGHDAAPDLSFSRTSSRLSGLAEGGMNDWRKQRAVNKVERKARRATSKGTSGFTVMANTEFETLFQAHDRNDEVGFRLLFTAMAQQNMLKLLNDRSVGYGDDFAFTKDGKLHFVESKHLAETETCPDPRTFHSLSLEAARANFRTVHREYFKSLFFSFAPLWTVPLFTDRPSKPGPRSVGSVPWGSSWEHEVMANYIGEDTFRHPSSVTSNLLRVTSSHRPDGSSIATVDAHGYEGIPQVDVIPMRGGDGNIHPVPVPWTEYLPVARRSSMLIGVVDDSGSEARWNAAVRSSSSSGAVHRRGNLAAMILG